MFYKNARIFTSDFKFVNGAFEVTEDGKFGKILPEAVPSDAIDLQGAFSGGAMDKNLPANSGDRGSVIPGPGGFHILWSS